MMGWNNDELMIQTYLDMRVACDADIMLRLKKEGWEILNLLRIHGERRYTMVLPEREKQGYVFTERNALQRFRQLLGREKEQHPALCRVS